MSRERRNDSIRKLFLGIWALATLVLVFSLALIVFELARQGNHPLPPPDPSAAAPITDTPSLVEIPSRRPVNLFFSAPDGTGLVPERREFELTSFTQENCRLILDALIRGPRAALAPVIPPSVRVRSVFLLDTGELVVDFSQEIQTDMTRPKSASAEALMVYSITNTLTQESVRGEGDGGVQGVRFLLEGAPFDYTFPEHIDLTSVIGPASAWVLTSDAVMPPPAVPAPEAADRSLLPVPARGERVAS